MGFLLLGVDSLIAGMAIGPVVERRWRLPLAALFGIADAAVFLLAPCADVRRASIRREPEL